MFNIFVRHPKPQSLDQVSGGIGGKGDPWERVDISFPGEGGKKKDERVRPFLMVEKTANSG